MTGTHDHGAAPSGAVNLTKYAWLSIAAALATIALKTGAWWITGSVGLLSDAAESVVNLVAAVIALVALTVAARPPDAEHHYGHGKAEYFSAAIEGLMIFVAAAIILVTAVQRLVQPGSSSRASASASRSRSSPRRSTASWAFSSSASAASSGRPRSPPTASTS